MRFSAESVFAILVQITEYLILQPKLNVPLPLASTRSTYFTVLLLRSSLCRIDPLQDQWYFPEKEDGMKTLSFAIITIGSMCSALPGFASGISICDGVSGNIVQNCGFEDGVYTSTLDGSTNTSVPNDWTPNSGFDFAPAFDHLSLAPVNSGNDALSIGNDDNQPVPALSQVLTDTSGTTYNGSLYVDYGGTGTTDPNPFFDVQINGVNEVALGPTAPGGDDTFTQYTFSFVGTGSDTLTLTGNTTPSEWYVDDVVVTAGSTSAVPEPRLPLLLAGLFGSFLLIRQRVRLW
jgi:hypothetical protein